ncbi:uncharacterized protein [Oryza sativa Japonica Group]|uniref:Expressed protein n=4 Tax=Oryza sativa subsp. japonica TaxID=39947 RepID=Q0DPU6_ORYSJ|nr:uncharacterized protein LOC4333636 isoform X1 [Oryza sativa Japonica Group]AAS07341.1 expressed protein [Oryza sativa Japonica Group]ABF98024.1 expressed protein [Oryza sativa Japonica Group]ABF98025.1 expressed protein [Oryza sativa Japonica Group]ABF98026.1 expressed protein [Oryza sativa Japonica Group]BAF12742.1 Os03g0661800 [Oryza sativa Japonica Group]|eukprot:NP_001050828.1 Os03g0661800 [Oryza sativa Japonica Group]
MKSRRALWISRERTRRTANYEDRENPFWALAGMPPPSSVPCQLQSTGGTGMESSPEHLPSPPCQARTPSPPPSGRASSPSQLLPWEQRERERIQSPPMSGRASSPSQQLPWEEGACPERVRSSPMSGRASSSLQQLPWEERTCPERIPSLPKKKMYWFARSREANSVQVSRPGEASYPEATEGKPEYNLHVLKSMKKKKKKKKKRGKRNKRGQGGSEDKSQEKQEVAQEHLGSVSSSYSSPLREPQAPLVPMWTSPSGEVVYGITDDPTAAEAYHWAFHEYKNKRARQELLPTVRSSISAAIEHYNPEQKKTQINASKSIVSLSAYHDGREINQGTGIIIECDEVKNSAIILTSAWLICIKKPFDDWSHKDYAPEAKVTVHMLDDTISVCRLLYFSKHFDIALFETVGGLTIPIMPLKSDLEYGQDFCVLTRDINIDLICTTVKVKYLDPYEHQHNHYMFIGGSIPKCGTGGALADFSGNTVGMLFCTLPMVAFLPSSLILTCLRLWKKFGQIVRPQLGLKFKTVDFQEMTLIELLSRKYNITSGLIVGEVSAECAAEKLGIRVGDIILSLSREKAFQV